MMQPQFSLTKSSIPSNGTFGVILAVFLLNITRGLSLSHCTPVPLNLIQYCKKNFAVKIKLYS